MIDEHFYLVRNACIAFGICFTILIASVAYFISKMHKRTFSENVSEKHADERVRYFLERNPEIFGWWWKIPREKREEIVKKTANKLILFNKIISD